MAIDTTLSGEDANSYISLDDANTFFDGRLYSALWTDADDALKEQALRTATRRIDMEKYYGFKTVSIQALAFPRNDLGYLDGILLDGIIPRQLKEAQCELAIFLLGNDMSQVADTTGAIKKEKLDGMETEYFGSSIDTVTKDSDVLPPFVVSLLADISKTISNGGTITIGR